ncbi:hypothetical protein BU24DRAFT_265747 [Aaosphaeria arxii CBS 175.79]|uniref:Uncharacterized protein n=1 Tax=Aaosphaeria arxii CBS 175.79 TaxID=1450172 RepID=A0A6A5XGA3_9PLEO|nr:uncharacterized protein BU24DRAFT_265747 [Aaosphaeria arxii CBS 175.79]KAF2011886.1 hypothetical protein BU24DRAFT_265747 [Aaosphaeria arxii CBS 175.79]
MYGVRAVQHFRIHYHIQRCLTILHRAGLNNAKSLATGDQSMPNTQRLGLFAAPNDAEERQCSGSKQPCKMLVCRGRIYCPSPAIQQDKAPRLMNRLAVRTWELYVGIISISTLKQIARELIFQTRTTYGVFKAKSSFFNEGMSVENDRLSKWMLRLDERALENAAYTETPPGGLVDEGMM